MTPVTFTVAGDPVPQPRPRVSTRGGYGRAYVPAKHPVHQFRARVAHAAQAAGLTETPSPVAVTIEATFGRPRSHYRKAGVKPTAPGCRRRPRGQRATAAGLAEEPRAALRAAR